MLANGVFAPPLPWPPDLLSLELDRAPDGGLLLSLLFAQPQLPQPRQVLSGAAATAAALRLPLALSRAACALLRAAAPGACLAPCSHAPAAPLPAGLCSLHQAAVASPEVLLRGGSLGGAGSGPWLTPWVRGEALALAGAGAAGGGAPQPQLRWGLGLLRNASMGARLVALASLPLPAHCGASAGSSAEGAAASGSGLPWGAEYAAGGALHLSIVRPSGAQPNAAWWAPREGEAAAAAAPLPPQPQQQQPPATAAASLLGTGLARTLELQLAGLPRAPGALALLLTIPASAFVDLDELRGLPPPRPPLAAFTPYLDIEQPAPPSSQHALLLRYGAQSGSGRLAARLPLHLRHGAPGCAAAAAVAASPGDAARHAALLAPWRAAHPAALPRALFADGSALLAGSGAQDRFPRFGGCFRLSPPPLWRAYWAPNASAEWARLPLSSSSGALAPALVPVGSADSREAVDALTAAALALALALALLLVLLVRRRAAAASSKAE